MPVVKKRIGFFESIEGREVRASLQSMVSDNSYNTLASYSADTVAYPDNLIPFVNKHMQYLNTYPGINTIDYLSNLRLTTRIRHGR